jgi:hypothetical protein
MYQFLEKLLVCDPAQCLQRSSRRVDVRAPTTTIASADDKALSEIKQIMLSMMLPRFHQERLVYQNMLCCARAGHNRSQLMVSLHQRHLSLNLSRRNVENERAGEA